MTEGYSAPCSRCGKIIIFCATEQESIDIEDFEFWCPGCDD